MDFSRVELSDDDQAFLDEARDFLRTHVTEEVIRRDRETGDNFDEGVHLAFGEAGYLAQEWKSESDGGFNRLRNRIWQLEKRRAHVPWVTSGTTAMIARSVEKFGSPELKAEVMPRVFSGHVRLCLGYTEPEGGSDVATCKTRAVRDGDGWVINGSKMFTTGAHNCQYVFLITNTDPDAPKHKSLTMFLVPLDSPGIEIQGVRTVDGDRTNIVYYSDVRVDDKYRLGDVNDGWTVVREPLNVEHGAVAAAQDGLQDVSIMMHQAGFMATAVDKAAAKVTETGPDGRRLIDDGSVAYRLGRSVARMEASLSAPSIFGRVALAQTMRDISPDLMDILGTAASLPVGTDGAADDGAAEYVYRFAPLVGIYGGTLEVFRNMIAQYMLGLGKPAYAPVAQEGVVVCLHAERARKALVMGASGFVGSHVVRKLVERGDDVRVYLRRSSLTVAIDDLDVERCYGDLRDEEALRAAMSDCDVVYYCVVDTRYHLRDPAPLFETNVESLRRVLDVAAQEDLFRFVFCSTIGTIAIAEGSELVTEDMPFNWHGIGGAYIESRRQAEDDGAATMRESGDCLPSSCACRTRTDRVTGSPPRG